MPPIRSTRSGETQAEPLTRCAIETARRVGAILMFPGNVYNFGKKMPELLQESTAQTPSTRKGRIRVELENLLREVAGSGLRSVVIRAGDFFGGPGRGSWFDLIIAKSLRKGIAVYPGPLHAIHAWAYCPIWHVRLSRSLSNARFCRCSRCCTSRGTH
jgi:nucleoside-diphosphate-sugar epimerase